MSSAASRPASTSQPEVGAAAPRSGADSPEAGAATGRPDLLAAVAGVSAGAVAVGLAELLAGLVPGLPSLVVSVGALVIALQPPGAKDVVTALFGTNDKLALNVAVVVVALAIAAGAGVAARRDFTRAIGIYLVVGALAVFAAASNPLESVPLAVVNVAVAVGAGLAVLWYLMRQGGLMAGATNLEAPPPLGRAGATDLGAARSSGRAGATDLAAARPFGGPGATDGEAAHPQGRSAGSETGAHAAPVWHADDVLRADDVRGSVRSESANGAVVEWAASEGTRSTANTTFTPAAGQGLTPMPDWARRRFLIQAGGFMAAAAVAGFVGRSLLNRSTATQKAAVTSLPRPSESVPPLTASQSIGAPGISSIVTPDSSFYRIDTELIVPQVSAAGWHLEITGMVDHPLTFSYTDLLKLPLFEQYVTLACVSNPVGGPLVGNALWTGVSLKQLLSMAGVKSGASQIVGRAVDGFTVGFPTSWALDPAREPMVVVGMNRQILPAKHGYPARLIVPGLYGYVSATKWLTQIELTTMQAFNAYWVNLGWNKLGPMVTQSRIDHPGPGTHLTAGTVEVDGVAWAGDRGIKRVQIQVDDGPWQDAELSRAISPATWVQWLVRWQATSGQHTIQVRAIDGTGAVQTAQVSGPGPGGATGYDEVSVYVG